MRFDRESWRKLYVAESIEHRLMSLFSRGLRDYLLRFAEEDGTLLRSTEEPVEDLCKVLNAGPGERRNVRDSVAKLLQIGYLRLELGRLWIAKFAEAQTAQSGGARRQAEYMARKRGASPRDVSTDVSSDVSTDVTPDETRRDPTRRDERPPTPKPKRWRTVPEDWEPKEKHLKLAESLGIPDPAAQLACFRDHEFRDPKTDADKAFSTWLRRAAEYRNSRPAKPPGLQQHEETKPPSHTEFKRTREPGRINIPPEMLAKLGARM